MKFFTYFILISYLMVGAGLAAVSLTDVISPLFLAGITGIAFLNLVLSMKGKTIHISSFLWNSFALTILAAALIDYFFISQSLIEVSVRFLTLLMVAKLSDLKTNRDYAVLYILTFFQLLSASASTVNLSFLFVLSLYILTGIWALTIFTLKKDFEEQSPHKEIAKNILSPYFFLATAGLAALSLVITLSLFFVIPRMEIGFFPQKTVDTVKITGFSETIDLGELGPIKLDPTIVMRVEIQPPLPPPLLKGGLGGLYFRGMSFDHYHGTQWQQTMSEKKPLPKTQYGIFTPFSRSTGEPVVADNERLIQQVILLEPIETNVLFAASHGMGITGKFQNTSRLYGDSAGSFYLPAPSYSRIEYTAYSIPPTLPRDITAKATYGEKAPLPYLQIPTGMERVYGLTRDITKGLHTPVEKAVAIETYLKKNYGYTLNPKKGDGKNPVEDFLFYTKEGYCEQYATAMTVMLRTIGIPSRLVTGFLPGEWNKLGNYLIIRGRDAHSWVEAYMPGADWATFDPTPSAEAVGAVPKPTPLLILSIDSLRWKWNRYIINYSFRDQINLAIRVEEKSRSFMSNVQWKSFKKGIAVPEKDMLICGAAFIIGVVILIAIRKGWLAQGGTRWPKVPFFYKYMLKILAHKGKIRKKGETALEFAHAVNIKEVKAVTEAYHKVRFGGLKLTDKEEGELLMCLSALKHMRI